MIDLAGRLVILLAIIVCVRFYQVHQSTLFLKLTDHENNIAFERIFQSKIGALLKSKTHLHVSGASGIGKTHLLRAITSTVHKLNDGTTIVFAPFQFNFDAAGNGFNGTSEIIHHMESTVQEFEFNLLSHLHQDIPQWLTVFLVRNWWQLISFGQFSTVQSFSKCCTHKAEESKSVDNILQYVVDTVNEFNNLLAIYDGSQPSRIVPIIVLEELHVLDDHRFASAREGVREFVWRMLSARQAAGACVVVSSTQADSIEFLNTAGRSVDRYMSTEHIGDLSRDETRRFLQQAAVQGAAQRQLLEGRNGSFVGAGRESLGAVSKLAAVLSHEQEFNKLHSLYGGYIPDLLRLIDAHMDSPSGDNITISDSSRVHYFGAKLDTELSRLELSVGAVLTVFKSIVTGVSPRGAVSVTKLVDTLGVAERDLHKMIAAQLVELRLFNPTVLDYDELHALAGEAYVCAPAPLARESMSRIVKRIEKRRSSAGSGSGNGGGKWSSEGAGTQPAVNNKQREAGEHAKINNNNSNKKTRAGPKTADRRDATAADHSDTSSSSSSSFSATPDKSEDKDKVIKNSAARPAKMAANKATGSRREL